MCIPRASRPFSHIFSYLNLYFHSHLNTDGSNKNPQHYCLSTEHQKLFPYPPRHLSPPCRLLRDTTAHVSQVPKVEPLSIFPLTTSKSVAGKSTQRPPLPPASDPLPSFSLFNTTLPTILLPTHPAPHRTAKTVPSSSASSSSKSSYGYYLPTYLPTHLPNLI